MTSGVLLQVGLATVAKPQYAVIHINSYAVERCLNASLQRHTQVLNAIVVVC